MGLFGNSNNNEAKKEEKARALLEKYGLQELSDPRDIESLKNISYDIVGSKLIETGLILQGNTTDSAKLSYLSAIMQQNFIMIRQLDRIAKALEK